MRTVGCLAVVGLALALTAPAAEAKPGKDFWKILVKANAKWVLVDTTSKDKNATITFETYDVRKVGDADVARLRMTHRWGPGKADMADASGSVLPVQLAVNAKGLYFLNDTKDDAKILAVLKGKPTRSAPPKAYNGTKVNKGRFLHIEGDMVCMGEEPLEDAGPCDDVCEGQVCISATEGVVSLHGTSSPNHDDWEQK